MLDALLFCESEDKSMVFRWWAYTIGCRYLNFQDCL